MSFTPENFAVWTEIPVTDIDKAIAFYNAVFKIEMEKDLTGPNPMAVFPTANKSGVAGHLYPGKPAKKGEGPTVHFASPDDLKQAMKRVTDAGGAITSDIITIPAGKFVYAQDPDGNSIGLFTY